MGTTHAKDVADWLATHPAPIHTREVQVWSDRVRAELGDAAFGELVELLAHGDLEQQYQAVAAARSLGAEVWADGEEPAMTWFRIPGESRRRRVCPEHQLSG